MYSQSALMICYFGNVKTCLDLHNGKAQVKEGPCEWKEYRVLEKTYFNISTVHISSSCSIYTQLTRVIYFQSSIHPYRHTTTSKGNEGHTTYINTHGTHKARKRTNCTYKILHQSF